VAPRVAARFAAPGDGAPRLEAIFGCGGGASGTVELGSTAAIATASVIPVFGGPNCRRWSWGFGTRAGSIRSRVTSMLARAKGGA
jgi:hypothetical protein